MKAIVIQRLNRRIGSPSVNAPKLSPLEAGTCIDIAQKTTGDKVDGNDVWYKTTEGWYVWSGGVEDTGIPLSSINLRSSRAIELTDNNLKWWHKKYQISSIWKDYKTMGEDVKIAILDSGINLKSQYFNYDLITGWNYLANNSNYSDNDGHGNNVAGIISGYNLDYCGIAPNAQLFIAKINDNNSSNEDILRGLTSCLDRIPYSDIDIISLSYSFFKKNFSQELIDKIKKVTYKYIVSSVGNDGQYFMVNKYPASIDGVFSVAACDENDNILSTSTKSDKIDLTAPGDLISLDFQADKIIPFSGTSASVPVVSGVLALLLSFLKKKKMASEINLMDILTRTARSDPNLDRNLFGNGIIQPLSAFEELVKIYKV